MLEKFVRENALGPVLSTIVEEVDSRHLSRAKTAPQDLDVKGRWGEKGIRGKWAVIRGRLEKEAVKMKIGAKGVPAVGRKKRGGPRVPGCTSAELRTCSYRLETCPRFFREASGTPLQTTSRLLGSGFESLLGMKIGVNELRRLKEKDAETSHSAQVRGATSINLTHSARIADTRYKDNLLVHISEASVVSAGFVTFHSTHAARGGLPLPEQQQAATCAPVVLYDAPESSSISSHTKTAWSTKDRQTLSAAIEEQRSAGGAVSYASIARDSRYVFSAGIEAGAGATKVGKLKSMAASPTFKRWVLAQKSSRQAASEADDLDTTDYLPQNLYIQQSKKIYTRRKSNQS